MDTPPVKKQRTGRYVVIVGMSDLHWFERRGSSDALSFFPNACADFEFYVNLATEHCAPLIIVLTGDVWFGPASGAYINRAAVAAESTDGGFVCLVGGNHDSGLWQAWSDMYRGADPPCVRYARTMVSKDDAIEESKQWLARVDSDPPLCGPIVVGQMNVKVDDTVIVLRSLCDVKIRSGYRDFAVGSDKMLEKTLQMEIDASMEFVQQIKSDTHCVFATHFPPRGFHGGDKFGSVRVLEFLRQYQPELVMFGHDHGRAGNVDRLHDRNPFCYERETRVDCYEHNTGCEKDDYLNQQSTTSTDLYRDDVTTMPQDEFLDCVKASVPVKAWVVNPTLRKAVLVTVDDKECDATRKREFACETMCTRRTADMYFL